MSLKENRILRSNWQVNLHSKCSQQTAQERESRNEFCPMWLSGGGSGQATEPANHNVLNLNVENRPDADQSASISSTANSKSPARAAWSTSRGCWTPGPGQWGSDLSARSQELVLPQQRLGLTHVLASTSLLICGYNSARGGCQAWLCNQALPWFWRQITTPNMYGYSTT